LNEDRIKDDTPNLNTYDDDKLERNSITLFLENNENNDILISTDQFKDKDFIKTKK